MAAKMTLLIRALWHLAIVLALASVCLYVGRAIVASYRKHDIPEIIRPLEVSGISDDAAKRGIILAYLLSGRLGEISKQMSSAEISWREAQNVTPGRVAIEGREEVIKPFQLSSNVFRPLDLNMSVANVEVGKLISWIHGWLAEDRALSLSVAYTGEKAVVSGDLKNGDSLWIETTGKNDVQMISDVAYAIAQKPYSINYPQVKYLEPHAFGELLGSLNRIALLSRKAPHTGVAPAEYQAEYDRLEPLMRQHLSKWPTLVDVVAGLAERSEKLDEALKLYKQELSLLDVKQDASTVRELQKKISAVTARIAAAKAPEVSVADLTDATQKVRTFMNVPPAPVAGAKRIRIGILGPAPAAGVLPESVRVDVVNKDIVAEEESDRFLADYVGHLVQSVRMVLPDVEFVFSQMKSEHGSMSDAAIVQSLGALLDVDKQVDIILHPYGAPARDPIPPAVLRTVAQRKILFVFAAGNERGRGSQIFPNDSPFRPGGELRKYVAVAAAVDLTGKPAGFTLQDAEVLWAPGTGVTKWQGTSLAAGLTAGAAAFLKAQRPELEPVEIVRILQETSAAKTDPKVKIIDVTAALAKATPPPP